SRSFNVLLPGQESMEFEITEVGRPDQAWKVINQAVVNLSTRIPFAGHLSGLQPGGAVNRGPLLVKKFFLPALGISLECYRSVFEMRQKDWCNPRVIVNYLTFCESGFRIKYLVEMRQTQFAPVNIYALWTHGLQVHWCYYRSKSRFPARILPRRAT